MFGKKQTEPTIEQRTAELAQQDKELKADTAEDRSEEAAYEAADKELDSAEKAYPLVLKDPYATPDDIARASKRCHTGRDLKVKTSTTLAAGRLRRGDLLARGQELGLRGNDLAKDRARLAHRANRALAMPHMLALEALEREQHRIVAEAPAGTGLVPCGFVQGVFSPAVTSLGPESPKSIFRHDVLRTIAVAYPDLVAEALPAEETADILAAIERDRAKGVILFAARISDWQFAGGWKQGKITADEHKTYLGGRLRREHHDL